MSDEPQDEPGPEDFKNFMDKALGGEKGTEDFFARLEKDPMAEAWVGFHEMYLAIQSGGFSKPEALFLMSGYLYHLVGGGEAEN